MSLSRRQFLLAMAEVSALAVFPFRGRGNWPGPDEGRVVSYDLSTNCDVAVWTEREVCEKSGLMILVTRFESARAMVDGDILAIEYELP